MGLLKTRLTWNVKEDNGVIQVSFFGWRPPGVGVRKVNCGLANGQRDWHTHTHGAEEEDDDDNKEAQTANRSFAWSRRVHTLTKGHHQGNRMFCNSLGCCVFYSLSLVRQTHTPNTRTTTHTPHALCLSQVCCWGFCCSQNCCQGFVPVTLPGLLQFEPSARAFILLLYTPDLPFRRSGVPVCDECTVPTVPSRKKSETTPLIEKSMRPRLILGSWTHYTIIIPDIETKWDSKRSETRENAEQQRPRSI